MSNITTFNFTEPTEQNVRTIVKNIVMHSQPQEQARWNEGFIDTRFWAGDQGYISAYYGNQPGSVPGNLYFNFIKSQVNMVTGYEREHRKRLKVIPVINKKNKLATQLTKALYYVDSTSQISEKFSRVFEMSAVTGLELMQPYLDYTKDCVNGSINIRHWTWNSFIIDPYFRDPSLSDANYVITQEFLSRESAKMEFPDKELPIRIMSGYRGKRDTFFYFLPENTTGTSANLLVKTNFWHKKTKKMPTVVNMITGEIYDYKGPISKIDDFARIYRDKLGLPVDVIETATSVWELATLLNDELMYFGPNPLGFNQCPFVAMMWDYDPQIPNPGLRARSLVRTMRSANWLFNRSLILNHDAYESSLNTGTLELENSLVNEDVTLKGGQGKRVIVKEEAARAMGGLQGAFQRLDPIGLPASNFEMPRMLQSLFPMLSGINQEMLGAASDDIPGILAMARRGAGLITLQKYFDQADLSMRYLGQLFLEIITRWWTPEKFTRIFDEEPVEDFFSLKFQQYDVIVEEGVNTATQQNAQFLQMLKLQEVLGPLGITMPLDMLLKNAPIEDLDEIVAHLQKQKMEMAEMQNQKQQIDMTYRELEMQNLQANTAEKLGLYKERVSRASANIGLKEERESEMLQNESNALMLKSKAVKTLIEAIQESTPEALEAAIRMLSLTAQGQKLEDNENERKAALTELQKSYELTPLLEELISANQTQGQNYDAEEQNAGQGLDNTLGRSEISLPLQGLSS